jgi:N-acetylmuramoyl-L-alanine amidase
VPSTGDPASVREAQERLRRLGFGPLDDEPGVLGAATSVSLQAFQRSRGLPITGQLDAETAARLREAGWTLGSRLLYLSAPYLRGDDVADLQVALALLGFDPGRIDGIFGPLTARALEEFQSNCAITASGTLTRETLFQLSRLSSRSAGRRPVTEARDVAGLTVNRSRRLVVLHGDGAIVDELAGDLRESVPTVDASTSSAAEAVTLANSDGAGLFVAARHDVAATALSLHYFATHHSKSLLGESLADEVSRRVRQNAAIPVDVKGMSIPVLRETQMTALEVVVPELSDDARAIVIDAVVGAINAAFQQG